MNNQGNNNLPFNGIRLEFPASPAPVDLFASATPQAQNSIAAAFKAFEQAAGKK